MKKCLVLLVIMILIIGITMTVEAGTVMLPESMMTIDDLAFFMDTSVTEMVFPPALKSIGSYSFAFSGVRKITANDDLNDIGSNAFEGCRDVSVLIRNDKVPAYAAFSRQAVVNEAIRINLLNADAALGTQGMFVCGDTAYTRLFSPAQDGNYTFAGFSGQSMSAYLTDAAGSRIGSETINPYGNDNFALNANLLAGESAILNISDASAPGVLYFTVTRTGDICFPIFQIGVNSITIKAGKMVKGIFTAPAAGTYSFYTTGSDNTIGYLYDKEGNELDANDDDGEDSNFLIRRDMAAGEKVYVCIRYSSDSGYGNVTLMIDQELPDPVVYRYFGVGLTYPNTDDALRGPDNDAIAMLDMVTGMSGTPYTGHNVFSASGKHNLCSQIRAAFAGADANDVSLFYYSGHGSKDGSLYLGPKDSLYPSELRSLLDEVPGKKIVILDSCYSGSFILKDASARETEVNLEAMADAFIDAFIDLESRTPGYLDESPYYVITACHQGQPSLSIGSYIYGKYAGLATLFILEGSGYHELSNTMTGNYEADSNGDGLLTLSEIYQYAYPRAYDRSYAKQQAMRCYPENSSQVLWAYR